MLLDMEKIMNSYGLWKLRNIFQSCINYNEVNMIKFSFAIEFSICRNYANSTCRKTYFAIQTSLLPNVQIMQICFQK